MGLCFLPFLDGMWMDGPAWSIFFELFANIGHALALHRMPNRLLGVVIAACAVLTLFHPNFDTGQGPAFLFGFPRVLLSYCLGILIWRLSGDKGRLPSIVGYVGLPLAIAVWTFAVPQRADIVFAIVVSPLLLFAGLSGSPRLGRFFGALSFPLYAVHWPALIVLIGSGVSWPLALAGSVLVAVTVGFIADRRFRQSVSRLKLVPDFRTEAAQTESSPAFESRQ